MLNSYTDRVRGELLREWRVSQQWEVAALASKSNLSVAQIVELEAGGCAHFYTPAIKESAARKVARLLGGDPAVVIRPLDDSLPLDEPVLIQSVTPLYRQKSVPARSTSVFLRQPGLVAAPILMLIAVVYASGWLHQKWQEGGSQQFWREASGVVLPDAVEPTTVGSGFQASALLSVAAPAVEAQEAGAAPKNAQAAVATLVAEPAQSSPVAAGLCRQTEPGTVLVPNRPSKSGDMVHIVAQKEGAVCVVDATGASTVVTLKVQEARSVYGAPPWRVHFESPEQAQLYFQGVRLRLPSTQVTTLALQEGHVSP
jgi:transcriptional regulator with XRE-family HTH domain